MSEDNQQRSAAALRYQPGKMAAPRMVAKGYGSLAERIIDEAKRHGVYVHESPDLVRVLMGLNLDAEIPPLLYTVVAELLAWVERLDEDT